MVIAMVSKINVGGGYRQPPARDWRTKLAGTRVALSTFLSQRQIVNSFVTERPDKQS